MMDIWDGISSSMLGYLNWVISEVTFTEKPWYQNYFLWLLVLSAIVFTLELAFPWRKNQKMFRKDFWMDFTYMFLNFYVFAFFLSGLFALMWQLFTMVGLNNDSFSIININSLPLWLGLLIFFVLNDFVQWFTHFLLHRYNFLWTFHKVHHSVKEMGFAAHLRYHWMENIFYKPLKTIVVMLLIGAKEPSMAFIVHFFAIAIGHLNHANLGWDYGPLKYVFNNPKMHIWHHAKVLPQSHKNGANYGISLSVWDYIFRTNYIPHSGRDIELGFEDEENFPKDIIGQSLYPFKK